MTTILHTISGAPRPWRVLLGFAFKGLTYETRLLEGSKGEHRRRPFIDLNPRATVPVLQVDGHVMWDSIGILAWLDRRYPETPLFGETADQAAEIWQITTDTGDYLRAAIDAVLRPVLVLQAPLPEPGTEKRAEIEQAAGTLHAECRRLEDLLDGRKFLAGGDQPSAAEAIAFPEIRLIERAFDTKYEIMSALGFDNPPARYPRVAAWKERVGALPGVAGTLPPHWFAPQAANT